MINESALDLKTVRHKSGLTQVDCAHLLNLNLPVYSRLENGKRAPTVRELCILLLVYGRSFESLFAGIFMDARGNLREQLPTIPDAPEKWLGRLNRQHTLNSLAERLVATQPQDNEV